jgi:uncharacterized membrane protein YeiH
MDGLRSIGRRLPLFGRYLTRRFTTAPLAAPSVGLLTASVPVGLVALDYLGTAAFSASGTLVAGQSGMDTLGCCFVGGITALGGGTVRDLLLGRLPVFWFSQTSFLGLSIATSLATFYFSESLESLGLLRSDVLLYGDTIGLGAFAVVGANAAFYSRAAVPTNASLGVVAVCGMHVCGARTCALR